MLARDLAEQIPMVQHSTTGAEAARILAEYRISALVVTDATGQPEAVIPGSQVLALILPSYLRENLGLTHAFDEVSADEMCKRLNDATVGELLERNALNVVELHSVLPEDTVVEIAAAMAGRRTPLTLVRSQDGVVHGVLTLSRVLAAVAAFAGHDTPLVRFRLDNDIVYRSQHLGIEQEPQADEDQS